MNEQTLKIVLLTILFGSFAVAAIGIFAAIWWHNRRAQRELGSAKRQAELRQFWKSEMQRTNPNMLYLISGASFEKSEDWNRYEQLLSQAERGLTMRPKGHPQGIELFSPSGQRFYFPYPTTPANQRATITKTPPPFERVDTKSEYYR